VGKADLDHNHVINFYEYIRAVFVPGKHKKTAVLTEHEKKESSKLRLAHAIMKASGHGSKATMIITKADLLTHLPHTEHQGFLEWLLGRPAISLCHPELNVPPEPRGYMSFFRQFDRHHQGAIDEKELILAVGTYLLSLENKPQDL